jgi:uncharacterized protein (TIGR00162 family)
MESIINVRMEKPELQAPILIEGLPGVGNVGKLAADHLLDQLEGVKFAEIYSKHLPPQVVLDEDCVISLVNNELFYVKDAGKGVDIIFLVGDHQGLTPEGQYELAANIIDIAQEMGVSRIYTLGGYGVGKMVEEVRVLGAITDISMKEDLEPHGVVFSAGEPGSGIVGASGLLLGLAQIHGIEAACLMGETSGYFVDPKGAEALCRVLASILGTEIDFSDLETKAQQIDVITSKIKEMENSQGGREDLGYIG